MHLANYATLAALDILDGGAVQVIAGLAVVFGVADVDVDDGVGAESGGLLTGFLEQVLVVSLGKAD